jgi:hypothetical protein
LLHDGENDSVVTDDTCKIEPTWNASVCKGDVGRLYFRGVGPVAAPRLGGGLNPGAGPAQQIAAAAAAAAAPARPPEQPVAVVRNGKEFKITGNQSVVRSGTEVRVNTERREVALSLSEMNKDSWVVFELPGFANAASGTKQDSLDAHCARRARRPISRTRTRCGSSCSSPRIRNRRFVRRSCKPASM